MKIDRFLGNLLAVFLLVGLGGCGPDPYAPPPVAAIVDSVDVEVKEFAGNPDVVAHVRGRLSNAAAQLVDARQSRRGYHLYIEVREQTPRGQTSSRTMVPFQRAIPVETIGLTPGMYILDVNGVRNRVEIPSSAGRPDRGSML